ncbi:MAG: PQQ-binding-like beta-propeller repeat protein [Planctomycetota bacterium]
MKINTPPRHRRRFSSAAVPVWLLLSLVFAVALSSLPGWAGDWPMLGGSPERNMVSAETGLAVEWSAKTKKNIKWTLPLGTTTYGNPVIAGGKVFVGTNNGGGLRRGLEGDKGVIACVDAASGKFLWQATHDKLPTGAAHDWPEQGIASTPWVEGVRLYYVSNQCQLVCADTEGFLDGENDGPYEDEKHTGPQDADFVWILDMFGELGVRPHNLAASSPVGDSALVFALTSNGVDENHEAVEAPEAPDLVAVEKKSGKLVWARNDAGANVVHGQWSSPAVGRVKGRPQLIFAGGDGWCRSYEPETGKPIWWFDMNPKDPAHAADERGRKTSIIATPVVHDDKVYLAAGDDPESGPGPGRLVAIDATQQGDVTATACLWSAGGEDFGRSLSTVAIADGLLYAADLSGFLYCFDAESGKRYWRFDTIAEVWGSPFVADGKVMLGTADGEIVVLQHGKEMKKLAANDLRGPIYSTPAAANGVLYATTLRALFAIAPSGELDLDGSTWPMFRGNPQMTGVARSTLPEELSVLWKFEAPDAITSSAAIAGGAVYVGCCDEHLYALRLADGELEWKYKASGPVQSSPLVVGKRLICGDDAGVIHAVNRADGTTAWTFASQGQVISSPNGDARRIVIGSYDGFLYCLSPENGKVLWKYETAGYVHAAPAIMGDRVVAVGCDERLHVVRLDDGQASLTVDLGSPSGASAAVRGSRAFVGTQGNQIAAIDCEAGRLLWQFEDPERPFPFLSSAALPENLVIIGGRDKRLRALDPSTGKARWEFLCGARVDSSPVVVGERIFVGSSDGNLYAVDARTGGELWRFESGAPITASPAVAAGRLVIGNEDGVLYCFGAKGPP